MIRSHFVYSPDRKVTACLHPRIAKLMDIDSEHAVSSAMSTANGEGTSWKRLAFALLIEVSEGPQT